MHYVNWGYKFGVHQKEFNDAIGTKTQMVVAEPKTNVYWLGQVEQDVRQTVNKWGKFIEAQIPEARLSKSEFHCTMIYDPKRDEKNRTKMAGGNKRTKSRDSLPVYHNR